MKFVLYFVLGWCLVCGLVGEAMAYSGSDLLESYQLYLNDRTAGNAIEIGICVGYVAGIKDAVSDWQIGTGKQTYCMPEEVSNDQLIRVVVKSLENNPTRLHLRASVTVQRAFIEAFPCTGD